MNPAFKGILADVHGNWDAPTHSALKNYHNA